LGKKKEKEERPPPVGGGGIHSTAFEMIESLIGVD